MDPSGNIVKRIDNSYGYQLLSTHLDVVCVATTSNQCRVLNPASGAVYVLPENPAAEHLNCAHVRDPFTLFTFGRAIDAGEYKVLRMFERMVIDGPQLCEVFTVNDSSGNASWRARQSPDVIVDMNSAVVVDGVVHFLMDSIYDDLLLSNVHPSVHPDSVASFDLGNEKWRKDIQGPISRIFNMENDDYLDYLSIRHEITLAEMKCSLVLVYYRPDLYIMDLWFLTDFDNGVWEREYRIQTESMQRSLTVEYRIKQFLALEDGRLVILFARTGLLLVCDPVNKMVVELEMRHLDTTAIYTGNQLRL